MIRLATTRFHPALRRLGARSGPCSRVQRAGERLERRLGHMVRVAAPRHREVQRDPRLVRELPDALDGFQNFGSAALGHAVVFVQFAPEDFEIQGLRV